MAIEETLREYIAEEIAGIYTISMVVVQEVDTTNRRAEVAFKYNPDIIIDNVPIASPFVGDGTGAIFPVEAGDEGFVLHNRRPISSGLKKSGFVEQTTDRRFEVEDAVLLPMIWNDQITVPDHEKGELLIAHNAADSSGDPAIFRMKPDGTVMLVAGEQSGGKTEVSLNADGSVVVTETGSGNVIKMHSDGRVTLGDPSSAKPILNMDATIEYEQRQDTSDGSGGTTTKEATIVDAGTSNVDGA